jgi:hypothetical protein
MNRAALALLAASLGGWSSVAQAQDPAPAAEQNVPAAPTLGVDAELRAVSNYLWRGYILSGGLPALQPQVNLMHEPSGVGLNVFVSSAFRTPVTVDQAAASVFYEYDVSKLLSLRAGWNLYLWPGADTAQSSGTDNLSYSGEATLSASLALEPLDIYLAYGRGHGITEGTSDAAGNSVNAWFGLTLKTPWEALTVEPYAQLDYLDEYDAPNTLRDRLTNVEGGLALRLSDGTFGVLLAGALVYIPSPYVRASNEVAAGSDSPWQPYASIAFTYSTEVHEQPDTEEHRDLEPIYFDIGIGPGIVVGRNTTAYDTVIRDGRIQIARTEQKLIVDGVLSFSGYVWGTRYLDHRVFDLEFLYPRPMLGLSLTDPTTTLYAGLQIDPIQFVDISAGVRWGATRRLIGYRGTAADPTLPAEPVVEEQVEPSGFVAVTFSTDLVWRWITR